MLQIKNICKEYKTGDLVQKALNDVSLVFRDNEFVAILGPSGSGKTTLLNIVGGLDRYDSGDLIINGISTKKYKDKDWDSYRNHTIGFVFQSYNLIPHQSVLSNVELALTISGISKSERRKRAKEALEKVGLGNQLHKKPNQMSGGQMQRVAIARALVNDPDILLADEPTGALDSETSVQVMDLLKEVAKDRLVVMVTHNPELAEQYATRIVKLKDGKILNDSNPYEVDETKLKEPEHKNMGKSSMSLLTSLSLSFNNLRTKKGRTFLTAFAGSIGIIGIALILSISNGVNTYISDIQKSTMTSYPISIKAQSIDISSYILEAQNEVLSDEVDHERDAIYSNVMLFNMASDFTTSVSENNLTAFKKYLDNPDSKIHDYIGENGIVYSYDMDFDVYTYDPEEVLVNTNGSSLASFKNEGFGMMMNNMSTMVSAVSENFEELIPDANGNGISKAITNNYEVLYGTWPQNYNEVVLVLDENNEIPLKTLYDLGILPSSEYKEIMKKIDSGEKMDLKSQSWSYEDICKKAFYMIPSCDYYIKNENGTFDNISNDEDKLKAAVENAIQLKITAVIRPQKDSDTNFGYSAIGYTRMLTNYLIDYTENSAVVKAQKENKEVNVLNGMTFTPKDDKTKAEDTKKYLSNLSISEKAKIGKYILQMSSQQSEQTQNMDETKLAAILDNYLKNPDEKALISMYDAYISTGSYEDNIEAFGVVSMDAPSAINIYTDSFENKDAISKCIEEYNEDVEEADKISYTDFVSLLMSSVTTIINVISYVLIAFVAVSLIVSSIMIGIITYISVLERTKEIGILRAIGASKRNISNVFNAETFIIGLCSGLIGIGITLLLLIPGNALIHALTGTTTVNASLPWLAAVILVLLSVVLTLIGGLIPSKKAAKKDPVTALRTE